MPAHDLNQAVRLWLEETLKREDRTLAKVARAIGVKEPRFNHWLTGRNKIPPDMYNDIAQYFDFPNDASWLMEVRRHYHARQSRFTRPRRGAA